MGRDEVRIVPATQGPQEGQRLATWPRSPDCRDVNCHKCPGDAWDMEADQAVPCRCDCHPGMAPEAVPAICPECGFTYPAHRFGCNREF